uniref:Cation/H+ exchanger domain-containing protein n=1 Tax=Populus trichocarpa TaxID=3694 RepID=A0A2K2ACF3_POPTR
MMVIVSVIITAIITPTRTIQRSKPDAEFRVLLCVHTHLNVPTINNLLEASHPTKRSPMCVYVTCNLAEEKLVALIIIPFHKQLTVDGGMEVTNPAFRMVNQNVLAKTPCSIGILVGRRLSGSTYLALNQASHHIAVLFIGGTYDREALSYAWSHPAIKLTVMRFIPGEDAIEPDDSGMLTVETENKNEKNLDEEYVNEFRIQTAHDGSIRYNEKVVNNGEETVAAMRSMDNHHDLFIVGRGHVMISPVTAGLTDWSECTELGAIGDLLASSDFAATVLVLVIAPIPTILQFITLPAFDSKTTLRSMTECSINITVFIKVCLKLAPCQGSVKSCC